jgi:hypothetical protein
LIWESCEAVEVGGDFQGTLSGVQGAGEPPIAALPLMRRVVIRAARAAATMLVAGPMPSASSAS